jgi:ABC-type glycerol-3-phosphate transport system substrate-binding protein
MFKAKFLSVLSLTFLAVACGGGGGSSSDDTSAVPINVSIQKLPLAAGMPTTITFPIHGQHQPYTDVTIDLAKTLAAANITVTAAPWSS